MQKDRPEETAHQTSEGTTSQSTPDPGRHRDQEPLEDSPLPQVPQQRNSRGYYDNRRGGRGYSRNPHYHHYSRNYNYRPRRDDQDHHNGRHKSNEATDEGQGGNEEANTQESSSPNQESTGYHGRGSPRRGYFRGNYNRGHGREERRESNGDNENEEGEDTERNDRDRESSGRHRSFFGYFNNRRRDSGRDNRQPDQDIGALTVKNEGLNDEIKQLKDQVASLLSEREQTNQLLKERTAELTSAQVFLGRADTTSAQEVSRMLDLLNAEISQAAVSITDSLSYRKQVANGSSDGDDLNHLLHKRERFVGKRLCLSLGRRVIQPGGEFDPMITQFALQAGLSTACTHLINAWGPVFEDDFINMGRIYKDMRATEGQVIAGRWRALAHTYINPTNAKEHLRKNHSKYLKHILQDLLVMVGSASRSADQSLPSEYKERMRILSSKTLQLQETIGRGITSMDLKVYAIAPDALFDFTKMDDVDGRRAKGSVPPDETIACTIELGLEYGKRIKGGGEELGIILKPKVLLASSLEDGEKDAPASRT